MKKMTVRQLTSEEDDSQLPSEEDNMPITCEEDNNQLNNDYFSLFQSLVIKTTILALVKKETFQSHVRKTKCW